MAHTIQLTEKERVLVMQYVGVDSLLIVQPQVLENRPELLATYKEKIQINGVDYLYKIVEEKYHPVGLSSTSFGLAIGAERTRRSIYITSKTQ